MTMLFYTLLFIAIVGIISNGIRIKLQKNPLKKTVYKLKIIDIITKLYMPVSFLVLTIGGAWHMTTQRILERIFYDDFFLFVFTILLFIFILIVFVPPLILFIQYYNIEKNRIVEFDPVERKIFIETKNGKSKLEIENSSIKLVEYFNGGLAKEPYDYEYLIITLNDNSQLILTNMTTDIWYYEPLFKKVKRKYNKRRTYNSIKSDNI